MKYEFYTDEQRVQDIKNKKIQLESQHAQASIDLKIARKLLKSDSAGADAKVMEMEKKVKDLEISLSALKDGE